MSVVTLFQLGFAICCFVLAGSSAKAWAMTPDTGRLLITLALYTIGNLVMLRLIRTMGMAVALSVSNVVQLVAVNAVALIFYGERLGLVRGVGVVLAVVAVALITLGPSLP